MPALAIADLPFNIRKQEMTNQHRLSPQSFAATFYSKLFVVSVSSVLAGALLFPSGVSAQRPSAPELMPDNTLLFVRIHNVMELRDRFTQTAIGRMVQDPQMKPLVDELYRSASKAFDKLQQQVGVSLPELLQIPQGEVSFGLVAPEKGGRISFVAMVGVGEQLPVAKKMLTRIREQQQSLSQNAIVESIGDTELRIFTNSSAPVNNEDPKIESSAELKKNGASLNVRVRGDGPREFCYFERDGVVVLCDARDVAKSILAAWNGGKAPSLSTNPRFAAIMNRCLSDKDGAPQITGYIDPIALAKQATQGNFSAQAVFSVLTGLGLNGIKGVGGSMIFAAEEFDSIVHLHLGLDNPRTGILDMLAIQEGDTTPEPWVPSDTENYVTVNWDARQTFNAIGKVYNTFRGENAWTNDVRKRASDPSGIDIDTELLPALDGRFTMVQWIQRPVTLNSETTLVGIRLKDAEEFRTLFERVTTKFADRIEKSSVGGFTVYRFKGGIGPQPEGNRQPPQGIRKPQPCGALVGDYLLVADSLQLIEHAIAAQNDGSDSLANELDFKLVASKISRQVGGHKPGMLAFNRPEEGLRAVYELATSELGKQRLNEFGSNNEFIGSVDRALKQHPLPPFPTLSQYLAPGGGLVTSDETGIHYMGFSLRRK